MFTPEEREQLRSKLALAAEADSRIIAAAHTGSWAAGTVDSWSDIDLALSLAPNATLDNVVADWTKLMYDRNDVVAYHDLRYGNPLFRVFLLKNTLQVDVAFWPSTDFRAIGPNFKLIFGNATEPRPIPIPQAKDLIHMGWLYALHVRASIARARPWEAEFMLRGMRDQVVALACLRHSLRPHQGREIDDLPLELQTTLAKSLVRSLDAAELKRAATATLRALCDEINFADAELWKSLQEPLRVLTETVG
jgi:predicted nucleotidyltransferase